MAEYCLECFNELYKKKYKKRRVVLDYDFCEGCGEWKKCVVRFRNPFLIIGGLAAALTVVLLSVLYHFGIFKVEPAVDYEYEYVTRNEFDDREIISATNLYIPSFEEQGFRFSQADIKIFSLKAEPEKICYIELLFSDAETYFITLTVFMPDAPEQAKRFADITYNQTTIKNKTVDIYENKEKNKYIARYFDVEGITYFVEPYFGFNDIENEFLSFLVSSLKRY